MKCPRHTSGEAAQGAVYRGGGDRTRAQSPADSGRPDIELTVPGEPKGKGRARFNRATGHAYTPSATQRAEQRIQLEWIDAGRPTVTGPLEIDIEMVFARPQGHWRIDGDLGAAGLRLPYPTKRPDWDNVGKLVADSLNGLAYLDDAQIVHATTVKRWATRDEAEHTVIRIRSLEPEAMAA